MISAKLKFLILQCRCASHNIVHPVNITMEVMRVKTHQALCHSMIIISTISSLDAMNTKSIQLVERRSLQRCYSKYQCVRT